MKSGFDPYSDYIPVGTMDLAQDFDRLWSAADNPDTADESDPHSISRVWLECNGEFADLGSVRRSGIQNTVLGIELVAFECPCCKQSHESLLFR